MALPEINEILIYVDRLTASTRESKIEWKRSNPSTFVWSTHAQSQPARVVLQQIGYRERFDNRGDEEGEEISIASRRPTIQR